MGSATSSMAAKLAFHPPSPPSYKIINDEETGKMRLSTASKMEDVDVLKMCTRRGNEIVTVFIKNPSASLTLVYSHGNAADLGHMLDLFVEISKHLGVNLVGYDYSGYGQSTGKASEQDTYADIEAVYKCLKETYELKEHDIILYGQSLGSGPTLELATKLPRLRAVILHSAILSGLRVMYSVKRTYWFDIFKNVDKIPLVTCPVLVIHGTADDVVPCSHGKQLWELCKDKYEPLWVEEGGHCNLELHPQYLPHLRRFISAVEKLPVQQQVATTHDQPDGKKESSGDGKSETTSSRHSVDSGDHRVRKVRADRGRRSVDGLVKHRASVDQPDKPRRSFDRFGEMVRSVGLCNVDCFKQTAATA